MVVEIIYDFGGGTDYGLGDLVRGLFATLEVAAAGDVRVSVDMTGHRLEPFLVYRTPADVRERAQALEPDCAMFQHNRSRTIAQVLAAAPGPVVRIRTNHYPAADPSEPARAFVRGLLAVRAEWRAQLPAGRYGLMHARLGDAQMLGPNPGGMAEPCGMAGPSELPEFVHRLVSETLAAAAPSQPTPSPRWLFMSDCGAILPLVRDTFPAVTVVGAEPDADPRFKAPPGHVGLHRDAGRAATTVRDMQLVCGASEIVTATCYTWVSGFVVWLAEAFGVPVRSFHQVPKRPGTGSGDRAALAALRRDFAPRPRTGLGAGRTFATFCAGPDDRRLAAGLALSRQALATGLFSRVVCYTDLDLREAGWPGHGCGIQRAFVVDRELAGMADGAVLLYADADCRVNGLQAARLVRLTRRLAVTPLLSAPPLGDDPVHSIGCCTKRDLLAAFDADRPEVLVRPQRQAGAMLMRKCARVAACVAEWWRVCSQAPHLVDDSPSATGEHDFFRQNRHDRSESVWNLCLLKHGLFGEDLPCSQRPTDDDPDVFVRLAPPK